VQNAKLGKPSRCGGADSRNVFFDTLMDKSYGIRRIGGDKIAFLALFVLSLVTARVVVGLKSTIVLSDPIALEGAGISVAVPVGNGWQSREQWVPDGDGHVVSSRFPPGPGEATARVICRYHPEIGANSPRMLFEQKAAKLNGVIVSIDQIVADSLIFNWAQIKGQESALTALLGTTVLPEGWQLDIEVFEITGDVKQAEETFKRVVEGVNYRGSLPRTALSRN